MYDTITVMIIALIGVLGIILGSFVNALVWRLHEQDELEGKKSKSAVARLQQLSITKGRSMCPQCGHVLAAKDLVPLLSWLALKGKCRYCNRPISWQYPLVELVTGVLFAVSYAAWPATMQGVGLFEFGLWLVFVVGFVALAVYDMHWFLLPDRIVFPLVGLAAVQVAVVALWTREWHDLYMALLSAGIIFGLFWGLYRVSKETWIGGGDVKLAIVLGLLAGTPIKAMLVIFFASLLGVFASVPLLLKGKKGLKTHVPFGPYLLAATFIVVLWGTAIVDWYMNLFAL